MAILGSHNSWSYMPVRRWWMRPIAFMARCQRVDIRKQYEMGVRCFDLRIRSGRDGELLVAHGCVTYEIGLFQLDVWLSWLNRKGDVMVRIIHEVRNRKQYTERARVLFADSCDYFVHKYQSIRFWCGRNLYNWQRDYDFINDPTCEEKYASVCSPKWIDDWWPLRFAKLYNHEIRERGTDKDVLLIDFVDID